MNKLGFDPRTQTLLLLIATVAIFVSKMSVIYGLFIFMAIYLIIQGQIKLMLKFTIAFVIVGYVQFLIVSSAIPAINFLGFLLL